MAESKPRESKARGRFRILDLSAVGIAFPVALLLGYFAGRTVGGWFGAERMGALIGTLLGIVSGFYNFFKMIVRLAPPLPPKGDSDDGEGS